MADTKEFEDNMTDAGTGTVNLDTRNLQLPSGDAWANQKLQVININKDNDYAVIPKGSTAWRIYASETTEFTNQAQYSKAIVHIAAPNSNANTRIGVACRYDLVNDRAIIGVLKGGGSGVDAVALYEQTNASTQTFVSEALFDWSRDTDYTIRLEVLDQAGSDIKCKIYIDASLKHTGTITNSDIHGSLGGPALAGKQAANWGPSNEGRWRRHLKRQTGRSWMRFIVTGISGSTGKIHIGFWTRSSRL